MKKIIALNKYKPKDLQLTYLPIHDVTPCVYIKP